MEGIGVQSPHFIGEETVTHRGWELCSRSGTWPEPTVANTAEANELSRWSGQDLHGRLAHK